jgi:HK97 family phage prohead protease
MDNRVGGQAVTGVETRTIAAQLEVRGGGDGRTVTGLIVPFFAPAWIGTRFEETWVPGSLRAAPARLFAGHPRDDRDLPVSPPGRVWEAREGARGEWHLTSGNTHADDLLASIRDRAVSDLSVGFFPDETADEWSLDGRSVVRHGAELDHVAVVATGAIPGAGITAVRGVLSAADRNDLDDSQFAYVGPDGDRHLPIHDKAHVANALARLNQTDIPAEAKRKAFAKIAAAARRLGVDVSPEMTATYGRSMSWLAAMEHLERRAQLADRQLPISAELRAELDDVTQRKALARQLHGLVRPRP